MGRLRAPGMCPATGSTGSAAPEKRSAARASMSTPSRARRAACSASRTGSRSAAATKSPAAGAGAGTGGDAAAGRCPGGQPPVEHPDRSVAVMTQQPPGAGGGQAATAVIGHDGPSRAHAGGPHGRGEATGIGQRMAPPGAVGRGRRGQVGRQVDEHRARKVAVEVQIAPSAAGEVPADVEQHGRRGAGQARAQVRGADQRGAHAPIVSRLRPGRRREPGWVARIGPGVSHAATRTRAKARISATIITG